MFHSKQLKMSAFPFASDGSKLVKHKVGAEVDGARRLDHHDDDFALRELSVPTLCLTSLGPQVS
ncbi:hypothetical protein IscW_ISCW019935 [Ixodes scapularis]|uniref:Uncharacterized protein n=1 Tax=Ixodes scapularis TaxID=6945 RepID=B7PRR3_IXOSC|nr:hypothetical protein IscW_ISCW019935 [Ixodes scapularis]|eukprot:XP_002400842.1 hypothetical protein IscW_ISCW019935 [Ixodes scapularis]